MITPLKKHPGHGVAGVALFVLASALVVVWSTRRPSTAPVDEEPPSKLAVRPKPAAAVAASTEAKTVVVDEGPPIGLVAFDEHVTHHVRVPVDGFVINVRTKRGRTVKPGETLAMVFSPEVYVAELALIEEARNFTTQAQLADARRTLLRWGMPMAMITQVEKTGKARGMLPLIALRGGKVVEAKAWPGLFVESSELFTVTDPSRVWIFAELGKRDAERAAVGMRARVTRVGAKPVTATIAYLYRPAFDGSREARFELAAPIAPGTPVTIELLAR